MYQYIILFAILHSSLFAKDIFPTLTFKSIGYVSDFVVDKDKLYVATDMGTIDIFDMQTQKIVDQIVLEPLTTAMGNLISPKILSVDRYNGKTLIVSIGKNAFRNVWIYENYTLTQIIDEKKELTIKEARFVNDELIIFGTFGSEIILHDTAEHYNLYKSHISQSTMGDISLSDDKKKMLFSDESGEIKLIDIKSSKVEQTYSSENVDNVYHVAYAQGTIITAGQDRRVGVYQKNKKAYHLKSDFLVYCVGVSPSGKTGVYSSGEEHHLQLFNTKTKRKTDTLVGHSTIINQIKFISETELFSAGSSNKIFYWKL